jgi:hypothetical protein
MPTKKLETVPWTPIAYPPCNDPDHDPPKHMVFKPGNYLHSCPSCGRQLYFIVPGAFL